MIFYGHTVLFNWAFLASTNGNKRMGFDLLRSFSLLLISGESVLPVSGLYLPPAQPQDAPALPTGEMGILNQVRSVVHLCSLLNGKYYSISRLSSQQ